MEFSVIPILVLERFIFRIMKQTKIEDLKAYLDLLIEAKVPIFYYGETFEKEAAEVLLKAILRKLDLNLSSVVPEIIQITPAIKKEGLEDGFLSLKLLELEDLHETLNQKKFLPMDLNQESKVYTTRPLTQTDPALPLLKCPHCTGYFIPEDLSQHISDQHVERPVVPVSTTTNVETTNSPPDVPLEDQMRGKIIRLQRNANGGFGLGLKKPRGWNWRKWRVSDVKEGSMAAQYFKKGDKLTSIVVNGKDISNSSIDKFLIFWTLADSIVFTKK